MWEQVLGHSPLSVTDDFFILGGSTTTAMRMLSRIDEELHLKLPLSVILEHRTVRHLVSLLYENIEESTNPSSYHYPTMILMASPEKKYHKDGSMRDVEQYLNAPQMRLNADHVPATMSSASPIFLCPAAGGLAFPLHTLADQLGA